MISGYLFIYFKSAFVSLQGKFQISILSALVKFGSKSLGTYFCAGEMAERSNAAVLKTVDPKGPGVRIPLSPRMPTEL